MAIGRIQAAVRYPEVPPDESPPPAVLEGLKARLDRLLREAAGLDPRERAAGLRAALIEGRAAVAGLRDGVAATERELATERQHLADAERRGRLAAEVPDPETVAIAERFAARHRERVRVLERKLAVQRDEVALAEREMADLEAEFRAARIGADVTPAGPAPVPDLDDGRVADESDQRLRERAVEAQLAYLKKKLGKE